MRPRSELWDSVGARGFQLNRHAGRQFVQLSLASTGKETANQVAEDEGQRNYDPQAEPKPKTHLGSPLLEERYDRRPGMDSHPPPGLLEDTPIATNGVLRLEQTETALEVRKGELREQLPLHS
jgi:hypothetical protein